MKQYHNTYNKINPHFTSWMFGNSLAHTSDTVSSCILFTKYYSNLMNILYVIFQNSILFCLSPQIYHTAVQRRIAGRRGITGGSYIFSKSCERIVVANRATINFSFEDARDHYDHKSGELSSDSNPFL